MPTTVGIEELDSLVGRPLEPSDWLEVTQARIDTFADATEDHQWIHVDPQRAAAGPFGAPIAHGYLTLSLIVPLFTDLLDVQGVSTKLNYGLEKVRFPAPVKVGARIRLTAIIAEVTQLGGGWRQLTWDGTVEVEGEAKPACVARVVYSFQA